MSQVTFEKRDTAVNGGESQDIGTSSEVVFDGDDTDDCAYFWLYNNSDTLIWVEYGATATAGACFPVLPGGFIYEDRYSGPVAAVHEGSGNKALIKGIV